MANVDETVPVCDYEGSDYQDRFWGGGQRAYEDQVERIALRRFLPSRGGRLLDVGAGFGRLGDEYDGYEQVVLLDYSSTLLHEAQEQWGDDPRFVYVAANWYQMPFVTGAFDTLVQVRTLHHAADVPLLMRELARIICNGGDYVLEFANKRNLKAIGRYWLKKQEWSPFTPEPIEFVALNYNFETNWIRKQLEAVQFEPGEMVAVSHFRVGWLKQNVPTNWLVTADKWLQPTGGWLRLSPSVFVHSRRRQGAAAAKGLFACPHCKRPLPTPNQPHDALICAHADCQRQWAVDKGVYQFKEPV
ncbi:MAG TPA: class I SAM-dependent methyltransferase [Anaerolineae bacterium]|nr:class I SAM-dependent methyltransferase [Anaerolineae bacterium]